MAGDSLDQSEAFAKAVCSLSVGDIANARAAMARNKQAVLACRLDRPPISLSITNHHLPAVFRKILDPSSPHPADPQNPDRPAVDIAGLLMLNLISYDYDFSTSVSTKKWAKDPLAIIEQARADPALARLETGQEPVLSPAICALLSEFGHAYSDRSPGLSIVNFNAAIKAGFAVGDPHLLAAAIFHPPSQASVNRQRLEIVLPHLPDPLPGSVRDVLWCHALHADHAYNSTSPSQSGTSRAKLGPCQDILIENNIELAVDPSTPGFSNMIASAFGHAADHLANPILGCLAAQRARPDANMLLQVVMGVSGRRYTNMEQRRIVKMIDAFDFTPDCSRVLSCPLPGGKGNTALHRMISDGSFVLARKFIEMGASTSVLNKAQKTPLMCSKKRSKKMLDELGKIASMGLMQDKDHQFMLLKACRALDEKVACQMMDKGADLFGLSDQKDVLQEMFYDVIKAKPVNHSKAQSKIQKIVSHHVSLHGPLTLDQANRVLVGAATSASDDIVKMALEKGASPHALANGLGYLITSRARVHVDRFIKIMTALAAAGMDPDYRTKDGILLFEPVWKEPAFIRAVNSLESAMEMQKAVAQVPDTASVAPTRGPRF